MTEAQTDLIGELQRELDDRKIRLDTAKRDSDTESATYHRDRMTALETALNALKTK